MDSPGGVGIRLAMVQAPPPLTLPPLQRTRGRGALTVGPAGLQRLFQEGSAKIRLVRDAASPLPEAVLINSAGGLTGGDRLDWAAEVSDGGRLALTTQACEKIYRARDGEASVATTLTVGADARLDWLPQETILFDGGALTRRLDADLAARARLLAVEAVVLGRTAMKETVRAGALRDRWRIHRDGRLAFADDLRLKGSIADVAARAPMLAGARAFASLLLVADDAIRFLEPLRACLGRLGGASAFDGKLFARMAAPDGFALRRVLVPALSILRDGAPLPRVWSA